MVEEMFEGLLGVTSVWWLVGRRRDPGMYALPDHTVLAVNPPGGGRREPKQACVSFCANGRTHEKHLWWRQVRVLRCHMRCKFYLRRV